MLFFDVVHQDIGSLDVTQWNKLWPSQLTVESRKTCRRKVQTQLLLSCHGTPRCTSPLTTREHKSQGQWDVLAVGTTKPRPSPRVLSTPAVPYSARHSVERNCLGLVDNAKTDVFCQGTARGSSWDTSSGSQTQPKQIDNERSIQKQTLSAT